jgi:carbamoyl-phosphate synthase small subunit
VQYHPEAAAGPHDAADLFDRFVDMMAEATGRGRHRLYDPPPGVAPPAVAPPDPQVEPAVPDSAHHPRPAPAEDEPTGGDQPDGVWFTPVPAGVANGAASGAPDGAPGSAEDADPTDGDGGPR